MGNTCVPREMMKIMVPNLEGTTDVMIVNYTRYSVNKVKRLVLVRKDTELSLPFSHVDVGRGFQRVDVRHIEIIDGVKYCFFSLKNYITKDTLIPATSMIIDTSNVNMV